MSAALVVLIGGSAFLVSALFSRGLSHYRGRWALLDVPNQRSLHADVKPRSGGLAILAGLAAAALVSPAFPPLWFIWQLLLALTLVACVSLLDDVRPLPAPARLLVHALAAGLLVYADGYVPSALVLPGLSWAWPAWLAGAVTLVFMMWMTNLYNFMDGMDGLAAGMGVSGFGTLALMGLIVGAPAYALVALAIAAAAGGFLLCNFPPARLFMGDVGAASLGFMAAAMLVWADKNGLFPLWLGALPFLPFVVDATWTVLRRTARGKRPWQAHREHFYQRLVTLGWSHRRVVLGEYALMLNCGLMAVGSLCFTAIGVQGVMLGEVAAVITACIAGINILEHHRRLTKRAGS